MSTRDDIQTRIDRVDRTATSIDENTTSVLAVLLHTELQSAYLCTEEYLELISPSHPEALRCVRSELLLQLDSSRLPPLWL